MTVGVGRRGRRRRWSAARSPPPAPLTLAARRRSSAVGGRCRSVAVGLRPSRPSSPSWPSGSAAGSNGSLAAPSTRRRLVVSSVVASAAETNVAGSALVLGSVGGAGATGAGLRLLGQHQRHRHQRAHEQQRDGPELAPDELVPGVGDQVHRDQSRWRSAVVAVAVAVVARRSGRGRAGRGGRGRPRPSRARCRSWRRSGRSAPASRRSPGGERDALDAHAGGR